MKGLAYFIFLFGLVFSAAQIIDSPDVTLYQIYTDPSMSRFQMQPGLRFEEVLTLSTDARVLSPGVSASDLQNNAVICEGNINAVFEPGGEWGRGFSAYSNYWQLCTPPGYSSTSSGQIFWSDSSYNRYEPIADCYPGDSCWGQEGPLINERVTYEDTVRTYPNSLGQSNVICKGVAYLYRGSAPPLVSRVIDGSPLTHSSAVTRGTYAFSGSMQVNGCAGIVRIPVCSPGDEQVEEIYSSTTLGSSPRPYTRAVPPATLNIRVVTNEDLRCQAEFISVTPSPLNVSPGGTQEITLNFRNPPCPASEPLCQNATIGRITVSNGFTFTQGITIPGGNTVAPGGTRSIAGTLRAPAYTECPTQLTFTAEYACPGCVGQIGGAPATLTVPFDCPTITTELPNLVPLLDPDTSRYDVPTGEQPNITITTWNRGTNESNPGDTCVDIGQWVPAGGFIPEWDSVASFRYPYPALAPGRQQPHGRLDFTCTPDMENNTYTMLVLADCGYTTQECANPLERCPAELDNLEERWLRCVPSYGPPPPGEETLECYLDPSYISNGAAGETYNFDLTCPEEMDGDATCAGGVDWRVTIPRGSNATVEEWSGNAIGGWVKIAEDSGAGDVHIEVEVDYGGGLNATCSSTITIPYIPCVEYI